MSVKWDKNHRIAGVKEGWPFICIKIFTKEKMPSSSMYIHQMTNRPCENSCHNILSTSMQTTEYQLDDD